MLVAACGGASDTGPLPIGHPTTVWTVAEPGARLTFGAVTLHNPLDRPLTIERIELLGRTDGFDLLGMHLAAVVNRPPHAFEPRYPPTLPDDVAAVEGYVLAPKPEPGHRAQLLVGMDVRRNRPAAGWHALRVEYRVGDDRYVAVEPFATAIVSDRNDPLLEPWTTEDGEPG
jgi:hypothetical protein